MFTFILLYNQIREGVAIVIKYRKEIFREILEYKASLSHIHDVIIRDTFNQDINSSSV